MIKIACDKCELVFEVEPAEAGGKASCPECGDVNRVPAKDPPVHAAADPATPHSERTPEQEICVVRPAMFRAHPLRGALLVLLLIAGVGLAIWSASAETVPTWLAWPGLAMIAGAVGWWLMWYLTVHLWIKLRISNKRTIRRQGIIHRHTSEVLHDHVRNVEIKQSFVQRMFDVGYLGISSSGQDGIEIEILDIPDPYKVKALIDEYRDM